MEKKKYSRTYIQIVEAEQTDFEIQLPVDPNFPTTSMKIFPVGSYIITVPQTQQKQVMDEEEFNFYYKEIKDNQ